MLNRDVKQYGKKYMFDGNEETCWNSDQVKELHFVLLFIICSCIIQRNSFEIVSHFPINVSSLIFFITGTIFLYRVNVSG